MTFECKQTWQLGMLSLVFFVIVFVNQQQQQQQQQQKHEYTEYNISEIE